MRALCLTTLLLGGLLAGCEQKTKAPQQPSTHLAGMTERISLSPAQVVRAMLQAAKDGDELAFWAHFSKDIRAQKDAADAALGRERRMFQVLTEVWTEQTTLSVGAEQIQGAQATVRVSGDKQTRAFLLTQEAGVWVYVGELKRDGTRNDLAKQIKQLVAKLEATASKKQDKR